MKEFFQDHKWAVILSILALIIVLLIYLIGWWTLLAGVLVVLAIFFGKGAAFGLLQRVFDRIHAADRFRVQPLHGNFS